MTEDVTQADRDAAWPFRPEGYGPPDKQAWDAGRYDKTNRVIQAFARHRIANQPPAQDADKFSAVFETQDSPLMGIQSVPIKRVEGQDDGTITLVLDYWPNAEKQASLPAQDGLDQHSPSGLRQRSYQIANVGEVIECRVCVDCYCGASFSATDEGEARQLWASHALASLGDKP